MLFDLKEDNYFNCPNVFYVKNDFKKIVLRFFFISKKIIISLFWNPKSIGKASIWKLSHYLHCTRCQIKHFSLTDNATENKCLTFHVVVPYDIRDLIMIPMWTKLEEQRGHERGYADVH
jgi:hypothetical protein